MKRVDLDEVNSLLDWPVRQEELESAVRSMAHELRLRRELTLYTHFAGEPRKSCIYCLASKSVHHPVAHNPDCPVKALEEMENSDE